MVRINFFIDTEQLDFLKNLPGKLSEHLRLAIARYIKEKRGENVSASQSQRKAGE